jgi:hypothetical protein
MSKINFYQGLNNLLSEIKKDSEEQSLEEKQIVVIQERIMEFFNVKNIHFLFGSGTSCNAIPNMKGLFQNAQKTIQVLGEDKKELKLEFESICDRVQQKGNLEEILGILYSYRIYLNNFDKEKDKALICNKLIEILEKVIFENINIDFKGNEAEKVLNTYKNFYRKIALRNKDLSRINVFTTNNDLFNETALDSLNIHYLNGFGGGLNKFFNPALFNYTFSKRMDTSIEKFEPVENMVNLYKIHGSVNWIEDTTKINTFFNIREVDGLTKYDNDKNILIYPTPTKQNKSLGSPYVELFREFQKKLLEPHSVLFIVGYSFSDEHVNNIIYQALATNSTINIVIINDLKDIGITKIDDNRIFRIWESMEDGDWENGKTPIHYFDNIVTKLLPDIDANKKHDNTLDDFISFYNKTLS